MVRDILASDIASSCRGWLSWRIFVSKTKIWTIALLLSSAVSAHASIHSLLRFNDYSISFADSAAFSDAKFDGLIAVNTFSDNNGDSANNVTWTFPQGTRYDWWQGFGNMVVSNQTQHADGSVTADLSTPTAGQGYHTISFGFNNTQITPSFNRDSSGTRWKLQFKSAAAGGVDDGNQYHYHLKLPGNWSQVGTGTGQHTFTYNPAWTIDNNFTFDGTNTNFNAHINAYVNDGAHNIDLDLNLYGAPVEFVLAPTSLTVGLGSIVSGNNASLGQDDGNPLKLCKAFVPNVGSPRVRFDSDFTSPVATPSNVKVVLKARMTTGGAFKVRAFVADRTGGGFAYGAANQAIADTTINLSYALYQGNSPQPSLNVHTDGTLRTRVEIQQTGFSAVAVPCTEFEFLNVHVAK